MMSVITNSYANVSSSFRGKIPEKYRGTAGGSGADPCHYRGFVGGGVARGVLVGILVTLVSLFFVPLQIHSGL